MRAGAAPAASTQVVNGRLQQWLLNPNGEVDGFLLADSGQGAAVTQVAFPPHLSTAVLASMKPGDAVQVEGWRTPNLPVLRASRLSATGKDGKANTSRSVTDQPPAFGSAPPPPREPGALTAMSASGRVSRLLYTDRGDANGALLDNGSIVRFPPHVGAAFAATLQPGSDLHAKGWGSRNAQGSALEATALGNSADSMRELFAGPANEPPPPRGMRGPREPRDPRGAGPIGPRPMPPAAGAAPQPPVPPAAS